MGSYKTVIFDLGRVLIDFDFSRGYALLDGKCAMPAAEIPSVLSKTGLVEKFESGLVETDEFFAGISAALQLKMSFGEFRQAWNHIFTDVLTPEPVLEGLASRYRLVLLSNTNALHFEILQEAYPLLRYFHALVLSHEVKAMKPRPEIYQAAIKAAECRPEECFYTDDILAYVEGARGFGIDAEQFRGAEALKDQLEMRGIEWR